MSAYRSSEHLSTRLYHTTTSCAMLRPGAAGRLGWGRSSLRKTTLPASLAGGGGSSSQQPSPSILPGQTRPKLVR